MNLRQFQTQGQGKYQQRQGQGQYPQRQGQGQYPQRQGQGQYTQGQGQGQYPQRQGQGQGQGQYPQRQGQYPQGQGQYPQRQGQRQYPQRQGQEQGSGPSVLGVYPVTEQTLFTISKNISEKCEIQSGNLIKPWDFRASIGKIELQNNQDKSKILNNYSKVDKNLIIAPVNAEFVTNNYNIIKKQNDILIDDETTLDISNLGKRIGHHINFDKDMQSVLFILATIYSNQRNNIRKIIFDNNGISKDNVFYNASFLFKNADTYSISGNRTKTAKVKKGIKVECDGVNKTDEADETGEADETEKPLVLDSFVESDKPPPSLPILSKRFQTVIRDEDQDNYFKEMMEKVFEPDSHALEHFFDSSAVFSFTISEKIENDNFPLYNFLKMNQCNLVKVSNANHKWLGTNFFIEKSNEFPSGMKSVSNDLIEVMPTVKIGNELYAVVVHAFLSISYMFANRQIDSDINSIHTFTIHSDGDAPLILSHHIFFYV